MGNIKAWLTAGLGIVSAILAALFYREKAWRAEEKAEHEKEGRDQAEKNLKAQAEGEEKFNETIKDIKRSKPKSGRFTDQL